MLFNCATMTTWRPRVRFRRTFRRNESEVPRNAGLSPGPGRRRGFAMGKKRKRATEVGDKKKRVPRNSAPYARWHFQTTIRAHSRNIRHLTRLRLTPLGCSRGEIQIYAPTAPGVFFELMKNESGRAALPLSSPLLSPPLALCNLPRFSPDASKLFWTHSLSRYATARGVYCRSCRRVKTSSNCPERY